MKCLNCNRQAGDLRFRICFDCATMQAIIHKEISIFMYQKKDRRNLADTSLDIAKKIIHQLNFKNHDSINSDPDRNHHLDDDCDPHAKLCD